MEYFDGNNDNDQRFTLSIFPNNILAVNAWDVAADKWLYLRQADSGSTQPTDSFFVSGRILRFATDSGGYYKPPTGTNSIRVEYDAIGMQLVGNGGQPVTVRQDAAGDYRLYVDVESDVTLSVDPNSNVPVNLRQVGGTSYSLGSKSMTGSIPVTIATDQNIFTVSAQPQGTYSVRQVETITISHGTNASVSQVTSPWIVRPQEPLSISQGTVSATQGTTPWSVSWTNFPTVSATQNGTYSVRQVETITVSAPQQSFTILSLFSGSDLAADTTGSDITLSNDRTGIFFLDWDENGGVAPTLDVNIQYKDRVTDKYINYAVFAQKTTGAAQAFGVIGPGATDTAQSDFGFGGMLPQVIRVVADLGGTQPTYSLTVSYQGKN